MKRELCGDVVLELCEDAMYELLEDETKLELCEANSNVPVAQSA